VIAVIAIIKHYDDIMDTFVRGRGLEPFDPKQEERSIKMREERKRRAIEMREKHIEERKKMRRLEDWVFREMVKRNDRMKEEEAKRAEEEYSNSDIVDSKEGGEGKRRNKNQANKKRKNKKKTHNKKH